VQAKLVRTLETRTMNPVGSNEEQCVDVRVVAATHRNLRSLVAAGKFREDLYYRLYVVHIDLPPLRQRQEDIPLLAATFLAQFNEEHDRGMQEVSLDAMGALQHYHWPGNVRELRNLLERVVVMSHREVIELDDLPAEIRGKTNDSAGRFRPGATLSELEREAIQQCLLQTGGNRQRAAQLLGISTRTLLRKIRKFALEDPLRPATPAPKESSVMH
jgi:two-component system response regulator AtoC